MPQPAPLVPRFPAAEVDAVMTEVNAGQDDLLAAAGNQGLNLFGNLLGRPAAEMRTNGRNDAVRAVEQAAVLHFDEGPLMAVEARDAARHVGDAKLLQFLGESVLVDDDLGHAGQPGHYFRSARG